MYTFAYVSTYVFVSRGKVNNVCAEGLKRHTKQNNRFLHTFTQQTQVCTFSV